MPRPHSARSARPACLYPARRANLTGWTRHCRVHPSKVRTCAWLLIQGSHFVCRRAARKMALGICPRLARHIPLVPNCMFGTKSFLYALHNFLQHLGDLRAAHRNIGNPMIDRFARIIQPARFRLFVGFIQQRAGVGIGEIFQDAVIRRIQMDEQAGLAGRSTAPPPSDSTMPLRWDSSLM